VKIQGYRIELGEIEAALQEYPNVQSAIAVAAKTPSDRCQLVAFVVLRSDSDDASAAANLRCFLVDKLPGYMVPTNITLLDRFPLTPNGKVDRLALTQLAAQSELEQSTGFVAPRTPLEKVLTALICKVLAVDQVGVSDNFFALGGDSISAMQLAGRIRELFEIEVSLRTMLTRPTVSDICEALVSDATQRERILAMATVLTELSGKEVERILAEVRAHG
jgi:acyl carrier protein